MSPMSLPPILQGTLPGFPPAPQPGLSESLVVMLLIPGLLSLLVTALGLGRRWLHRDPAAPSAPASSRPSAETLDARRELVHQAALRREPRGDLPMHAGKSDPEAYHP